MYPSYLYQHCVYIGYKRGNSVQPSYNALTCGTVLHNNPIWVLSRETLGQHDWQLKTIASLYCSYYSSPYISFFIRKNNSWKEGVYRASHLVAIAVRANDELPLYTRLFFSYCSSLSLPFYYYILHPQPINRPYESAGGYDYRLKRGTPVMRVFLFGS